jgi:hypothetical protein
MEAEPLKPMLFKEERAFPAVHSAETWGVPEKMAEGNPGLHDGFDHHCNRSRPAACDGPNPAKARDAAFPLAR